MRASASLGTCTVLGLFVAGAACGSSTATTSSSAGTGGATSTTSTTSSTSTTSTTSTSTGTSTGGASTSTSATTGTGGTGGSLVIDAGPVGNFPFPPITYQGGTIVAAPDIVTITYPGDPLASQFATFGASVAASSYWDAIRAGYCGSGSVLLGDGPAGTTVALTTAPAASYTDSAQGGASTFQTYLAGLITGEPVPAPTDNTIYMFYFPTTTTITPRRLAELPGLRRLPQRDDDGHAAGHLRDHPGVPGAADDADDRHPPEHDDHRQPRGHRDLPPTAARPSPSTSTLNDPATFGWDDVQGGEVADLCVDPFLLGQDETTENGVHRPAHLVDPERHRREEPVRAHPHRRGVLQHLPAQ